METDTIKNFRPKDYIRSIDEKAERRFYTAAITFGEVEQNGAKTQDENIIEGYGAVFNSDSEDFGGWIERIAPGAFSGVLNDDAYGLLNHSMNHILGRNKINMIIKEDESGLRYTIKLPDTSIAKDVRELVKTGIINKSSFAFTVAEERFVKGDPAAGKPHMRIIEKIGRLYDVSPVTIPAYPDTSVAARSLKKEEGKEQIKKALRDFGRKSLKAKLYKQSFKQKV